MQIEQFLFDEKGDGHAGFDAEHIPLRLAGVRSNIAIQINHIDGLEFLPNTSSKSVKRP